MVDLVPARTQGAIALFFPSCGALVAVQEHTKKEATRRHKVIDGLTHKEIKKRRDLLAHQYDFEYVDLSLHKDYFLIFFSWSGPNVHWPLRGEHSSVLTKGK
jgi:hypothetical protein